LEASSQAGARSASYILLRLPLTVEPVFREWLARALPNRVALVESRIKATRNGKWYESEFGKRMRGTGAIAEQIAQTFRVFAAKYGLNQPSPPLDATQFRKPRTSSGQQWLFPT
jgi:DNA repair photolyase